jgi:acyl carrier protein
MIREEVFKVVSNIINVPLQEVNEDSSTDTLAQWDSLRHISLILALEEKFMVQFREDQIIDMFNVKSIILTVEELKKV